MKNKLDRPANMSRVKPLDCKNLSGKMREYGITTQQLVDNAPFSKSQIEKYRSERCEGRVPSYETLQELAHYLSLLAIKNCITRGELSVLMEKQGVTVKQLAEKLGEAEEIVRSACIESKNRLNKIADKYTESLAAILPEPLITPQDLSDSYIKIFWMLAQLQERKESVADWVMEKYLTLIPNLAPLDVCNLILHFNFYDELDYNVCALLSTFSFLSDENKRLVMSEIGKDSLTFEEQLRKAPIMQKFYDTRKDIGRGAEKYLAKNVHVNKAKNGKDLKEEQLKILGGLLLREIDKVYQGVDSTEPLDLEDLSEKLEVIAQSWDDMDWDLVFIYQLLEGDYWEMSERQKQLFALVESYVDPQYLHPKELATV